MYQLNYVIYLNNLVRLIEDSSKDTADMFLLHWCLSGVNGLTDAAKLMEREKKEIFIDLLKNDTTLQNVHNCKFYLSEKQTMCLLMLNKNMFCPASLTGTPVHVANRRTDKIYRNWNRFLQPWRAEKHIRILNTLKFCVYGLQQ